MYHSILIGIDFSDTSVDTVRWAVSRFPEADITLFHAIERLGVPGYLSRELGSKLGMVQERELDARANLEAIAERCGIDVRIEVRAGWTPEALVAVSEEIKAELVVVGAHQKRVWPSDEVGNTCVAIVRKATVPVLVWRPVRQEKDKTILAALDLRDGSAPIAATAGGYAAYFGTRLVLMHAMPGTLQAYVRAVSSPTKTEDMVRVLEQRARAEALDRVPQEFREEVIPQDAPSGADNPYAQAAAQPGTSLADERREDIATKRQAQAATQAIIDAECAAWQAEVARLEPNRRVFTTDDKGETSRMDDQVRVDRVASLKDQISSKCK